ncbi:uncharacterized protein LOC113462538 isoform X2 [Phoenix dactylifera]|uniref:Uncharacterized protein LOC113462538 isoform X2 n=1 Tax=Phoenix dactylifera TaxID=42345 RepID=A0A8B8J2K5_PHODC|nr:uncharacterized protein LOC113462538 isoform X2 [Phoenix dactylifera]
MIWKLTQRFTLVYLGEKLHDEYLTESIHHSLLEQVLGDRVRVLLYMQAMRKTSFLLANQDFRLPYSRALANESRVKTGQVINIFLFYYM